MTRLEEIEARKLEIRDEVQEAETEERWEISYLEELFEERKEVGHSADTWNKAVED